jgi:hypothetical protein
LVLRLNKETIHDFILLFMTPCGPHLTPLATGSLERSILVFSTPGGLTGDDLSRLFFTCTNTSQPATCTCNLAKNQSTQCCQSLITQGSDHRLTQNPHPAPSTQQAEQVSLTHEQIPKRASQFSLKINKRQSS